MLGECKGGVRPAACGLRRAARSVQRRASRTYNSHHRRAALHQTFRKRHRPRYIPAASNAAPSSAAAAVVIVTAAGTGAGAGAAAATPPVPGATVASGRSVAARCWNRSRG